MNGVIIAAHGQFGKDLLKAIDMIMGGIEDVEVVTQEEREGRKELLGRIEEKLLALDSASGVLILTDLFGSTPSNVSLTLLEKYRDRNIKIITGMNLPMLMELGINRHLDDLDQLAARICNAGIKSIKNIGSADAHGRPGA